MLYIHVYVYIYVYVYVLQVRIQPQLVHDHRREREDRRKPFSHKQLQQQQRQKPATGPQHVTTSSGASQHEQLHKQPFRRQSSSDSSLIKLPVLDPNESAYADYVNLPPAETVPPKSRGAAQSPVNETHSSRRPVPSPRTPSIDAGRGAPLLPAHQTPHATTTSMPEPQCSHTMHELDDKQAEHDISDFIDVHIRNEAAKVVATGRDERRYTLTAIPFDPFLECLYCNQKFRYGEIQKYRKHVNNCSGSAA